MTEKQLVTWSGSYEHLRKEAQQFLEFQNLFFLGLNQPTGCIYKQFFYTLNETHREFTPENSNGLWFISLAGSRPSSGVNSFLVWGSVWLLSFSIQETGRLWDSLYLPTDIPHHRQVDYLVT